MMRLLGVTQLARKNIPCLTDNFAKRSLWLVIIGYWLLLLVWAIFSFSQTDPNLTLINQPLFINFQNMIWSWGGDRTRLVWIYAGIILSGFVCYGLIYQKLKQLNLSWEMISKRWGWKKLVLGYLLFCLPLFFSYNALSHDVFNYIFNAKMVVVYGANPHVRVALDFAFDNWTRFMHNTHTPAPYAYGWTALSLLPYVLGFGKFFSTWLMFRLMAFGSILLLAYSWWRYAKIADIKLKFHELVLVLLNPLVLIEVISNQHNDLWMMAPAILGLVLIASSQKNKWPMVGGWLLFGLSISIKYASLLLLPFYFWVIIASSLDKLLEKRLPQFITRWFMKQHQIISLTLKLMPLPVSIMMFLPLLLPRAQQFHPWYLLWVMVWIPLLPLMDEGNTHRGLWQVIAKTKLFQAIVGLRNWWIGLIIIFSLTSMLRYAPWLLSGGFSQSVLEQQKFITWSAVGISLVWWIISRFSKQTNLRKLT
ncbi:MAG: hypothetical protein ABIJ03_00210 [Patescibacteria group bacterium]|nr:hypothetical protein [Patescibacteria group bacterium]